MKDKKVFIGLASLLILIALSIGFVLYKNHTRTDPNIDVEEPASSNSEDELFEALGNLVQNANDIIDVYLNGPVSDTDYYTSEISGKVCAKYIGEDKNALINNILRTYEDPFFKGGIFEVTVEDEFIDEIYFCGVSTCELNNYSILDAQILDIDDSNASVSFSMIGVGLSKSANTWKFQKPLPVCKPNF